MSLVEIGHDEFQSAMEDISGENSVAVQFEVDEQSEDMENLDFTVNGDLNHSQGQSVVVENNQQDQNIVAENNQLDQSLTIVQPETLLYQSPELAAVGNSNPAQSGDIIYRIITKTSARGKDKVFDSLGYSYCLRKRHIHHVLWKCSKQAKKLTCPARVKQKDGVFVPMGKPHNHPPDVGCDVFSAIQQVAKRRGKEKENLSVSATTIVKDTLKGVLPENVTMNQSDIDKLSRIVNRHRQKIHTTPVHIPVNFPLNVEKLPTNFLKKDLLEPKNRIMIFATDSNLALLSKAKVWYVDTTTSLVSKPFKEMLLIQAFTKANKTIKQTPLVNCLFTKKQHKPDYLKAMREVISLLPCHSLVEKIVAKFDVSLWRALRQVLPGVDVKGGAYNFQQVIFKHVRTVGLEHKYSTDDETFDYIRKLMALCFLPHWHISPVFCNLIGHAPNDELIPLADFVGKTFFENRLWRPSSWSVYGCAFREFDCANLWQIRLSKRHKLSVPDFISYLYIEANVGKRQNVAEEKLKKYQKKNLELIHSKIFKIWRKYANGTHAALKILKKSAKVYGPEKLQYSLPFSIDEEE